MKIIIVKGKAIVVNNVVDLKMSMSEWISFRSDNPDLYWKLVHMGAIPEEILYSVELEFDD